MSWVSDSKDGAVLNIHAAPGAAKSRLQGLHGAALKVRIRAPPVEGRANAALVEFIAGFLDIPARHVHLIGGQTSRRKRLLIQGLTAGQILARCAPSGGG
jgi:uncharacterized protein (TIGR00251 family)